MNKRMSFYRGSRQRLVLCLLLFLSFTVSGCMSKSWMPESRVQNTETKNAEKKEPEQENTEKSEAVNNSETSEVLELSKMLPEWYDARKIGKAAPVRNQGRLGTCWAFASLSALESRLLPEENWDFSEDHMSHNPSFLLEQTGGGEYTMAMAYLLSWQGPVTEEQDPYGDGISPEDLPAVKHVQEIQVLPDNDLEAVKRAVIKYGGVESSIYVDMKSVEDDSDYYNRETAAYCCKEEREPNHDIVIVGWDDAFPREAFLTEVSADGAFLCENSWGETFGEDGFFYVSYEDGSIGENNIVYAEIEPKDNFTEIYQSDLCGWIGQLGYGEETAWAANVYTAQKDMNLEAIGFYTIDKSTEYEVYMMHDISMQPEVDSFSEKKEKAVGKLDYSGYYTIRLDEPEKVKAGERFAVIIRLKTPGAVHPIAIEYDAEDGKCNLRLDDGEGYISPDGMQWERTETMQGCNVCLKAYGTEILK